MGIYHDEKEEDLSEHEEVGKYFSLWMKNKLEKVINNG
jgi:hypothetical protein